MALHAIKTLKASCDNERLVNILADTLDVSVLRFAVTFYYHWYWIAEYNPFEGKFVLQNGDTHGTLLPKYAIILRPDIGPFSFEFSAVKDWQNGTNSPNK